MNYLQSNVKSKGVSPCDRVCIVVYAGSRKACTA